MARYWVGGDGIWNSSNTTNWSASSGGSGGASIPIITDDVYFDSNSGSGNVSIDPNVNCLNLDFTGSSVGANSSSYGIINIYGNLTLISGLLYEGQYKFKATSGTKTISATSPYDTQGGFIFDGSGGTFQLNSTLNITGTSIGDEKSFELLNGTFSANSNIVSFDNVVVTISGAITFYDLKLEYFNTSTSINKIVTLDANIVISNDLTMNGYGTGNNRLYIKSDETGTARTITCNGTISASYLDLEDITGAGSASWDLSAITGESGDCGGNSGITFTTGTTKTWNSGISGSFSDSTKWDTGTVPLPQDTCSLGISFTSDRTLTIDLFRVGEITTSGKTGAGELTIRTYGSQTTSAYGDLYLVDDIVYNGFYTFNVKLKGRGSHTLEFDYPSGTLLDDTITIDCGAGDYTLNSNLEFSRNPTKTSSLYIYSGTFDVNDYDIEVRNFYSTGDLTRVINMGTGTWRVYSSWTISGTSITLNEETSTITNEYTDDTFNDSTTFNGGDETYYNINIGYTGNTINDSNTFNELRIAPSSEIEFESSEIQTVDKIWINGASGSEITLASTSSGTPFTITKNAGLIGFNYCSIQDCTGGGTGSFYAYDSTDVSGNTNITFTSIAPTASYDKLTLYGEGYFDNIWIRNRVETSVYIQALTVANYSPTWDADTVFLALFTNSDLKAGNVVNVTSPVLNFVINKREVGSNIYETLNTVTNDGGNSFTYIDYRVQDGKTYQYQILPVTADEVAEALLSDEITSDYYGWFLIDEDNDIVYKFDTELNTSSLKGEFDQTEYPTYLTHNVFSQGNRNFLRGAIGGLIPTDSECTLTWSQTIDFCNEVQDFINNGENKLLKSIKGDLLLVTTKDYDRTLFSENTPSQPENLKFSFTEIERIA